MLKSCRRLLLVFFALGIYAFAQDEIPTEITPQNRGGELPFSSTVGTPIEQTDVTGGGLHVTIPIMHVPGRGLDYDFKLNYDARFWVEATRSAGVSGPYEIWNLEVGGLWSSSVPYVTHTTDTGFCNTQDINTGGPTGTVTYTHNYIYHDATGGKHSLGVNIESAECNEGTYNIRNAREPDLGASGLVATLRPPTGTDVSAVYLPNGTVALGGSPWDLGVYRDVYGNNQVVGPGGTDTLGRVMLTKVDNPGQTIYHVYDSTGTQQPYTINWQNLNLSTAFHMQDPYRPAGYNVQEFTGTRQVISSIVLPNQLFYSFQYDNYGMITQINFPTGAIVQYTWDNDPLQRVRYITSRTLIVNGQSSTWTFARAAGTTDECAPSNSCTKYTVTDPVQNQTVYCESILGKTYKVSIYQGAATGTPLRQYFIDFWSNDNDEIVLPTSITTKLNNGLVSKKEFTYDLATFDYTQCVADAPWECAEQSDLYIRNVQLQTPRGNVITMKEYDWGQGTPGPLLRTTTNKYLHEPGDNPSTATQYAAQNIVSKIIQQTITDANGNTAADTQYEYDNLTTTGPFLGSETKVKRWRNTDGAWLATSYSYDQFGNMVSMADPLGNPTTLSYDDNWANSGCQPPSNSQGYVTQITNAKGYRVQISRYPCTGQVQAHRDENDIQAGRTGTTFTYDFMNRPLVTNFPDGGQTGYFYQDAPNFNAPYVQRQDRTVDANTTTTSWTQLDGLGRVIRTAKLNGEASPNIVDDVDTCYDGLGEKVYQSYPYQMQGWQPGTYHCPTDPATPAGDSFVYDALGRVTRVTNADGSAVSTDYSQFPTTTVTDQAGNQRRNQTDALGRLTTVWEPDSNGNFSYETDYYYNALDNLEHVVQNGNDSTHPRQRDFQYDSLSRLTFANNPESGAIYYGYDANGNLVSKISPMPNQTSPTQIQFYYHYDELNRLQWRWNYTQSSDPVERYTYDVSGIWGTTVHNPIGRLVAAESDGSTTNPGNLGMVYSYDSMGRQEFELEYNKRGDNTVHKQFNYAYNLDGSLNSITYPSGRVVNYSYNAAQRPTSAVDPTNNISFATAAHYFASGGVGYVVNGTTPSFGGIVATENYNARMQPNEILVAVGAQPPVLDLIYDYYSCNGNGGNNGNVCQSINNKDGSRTQAFRYDQLNRLTAAWTPQPGTANSWANQYQYDPWGNLLQKVQIPNWPGEALNVAVNGNNQVTSWCYDAAGNIVGPNNTCANYASLAKPFENTYDGQNRLTSAQNNAGITTSYDYDADGQRVKKSNGSTNTLYWYGPGGEVLEETDLSGNLQNEYVFFGGKRVVRYSATNGYSYYFSDHLDSASVVTDASGNIKEESDYYPFGGERIVTDSGIGNNYKFTGKERDSESGLDNFGARYYCNPIGRFITPDWADKPTDVPYANFGNPQSLNLYSYVKNNPTTFGDPDGHAEKSFLRAYFEAIKNSTYVKLSCCKLDLNIGKAGLLKVSAGFTFGPHGNFENKWSSEENTRSEIRKIGFKLTVGKTSFGLEHSEKTVLIRNGQRIDNPTTETQNVLIRSVDSVKNKINGDLEVGVGVIYGAAAGINIDQAKQNVGEVEYQYIIQPIMDKLAYGLKDLANTQNDQGCQGQVCQREKGNDNGHLDFPK